MIFAKDIETTLFEVGGSKVRRYLKEEVPKMSDTIAYLINRVRSNEEIISIASNEEYHATDYHFFDIGFKNCVDFGRLYFSESTIHRKHPIHSFIDVDGKGESALENKTSEGKTEKESKTNSLVEEVMKSYSVLRPEEFDVLLNDFLKTSGKQWTISAVDKKDYSLSDLASIVVREDSGLKSIVLDGTAVSKEVCDLLGIATTLIKPDKEFVRLIDLVVKSEAMRFLFK